METTTYYITVERLQWKRGQKILQRGTDNTVAFRTRQRKELQFRQNQPLSVGKYEGEHHGT